MCGAQKATLSAICGITSRSFGSRSLKRELEADLVVPRAALGEGREQRLRLDAAPALNAAVNGRWPPLSISDCLMWMIGETFGTARAQA